MSEYSINNTRPMVMVRRNGAGELVKIEPDQKRDYLTPAAGEYDLEIRGFAEPFSMTSQQYGESTKTRLELVILSERGKGKVFTALYGWSVGPKSHLGKTIRKATAREIPDGEVDMAALLLPAEPIRFHATVSTSDDKLDQNGAPLYADVITDTVRPIGAAKPSYDPFKDEAPSAVPA